MTAGLLQFGGAFNPPHRTHRRVLEQALQQLEPAEVWVVPTGRHPHKTSDDVAPAEHRLAMCRLAFDDLPRVTVQDLETGRAGLSYTVDTLARIHGTRPDARPLYYLIGSDNLPLLHTWREPDRILSLCTLVTVPRAGSPIDAAALAGLGLDAEAVRAILDHALRMAPDAVSSSELRRRLRAEPGPIGELDPAVEAYIRRHHLYGS